MSTRKLQSRTARRWPRPICSSRSSCPSMEMLLHRHEHSCCIVKLSTACSLSLLSNFESHLVLFQQTMWFYVYWCPISCMNTWILFTIIYGFVWPLYFICKFKLNYYLQFCEHCDPVPVTKLISKLWRIDVIFVTKVMVNCDHFKSKGDDCK
jgi:hypothetical protein